MSTKTGEEPKISRTEQFWSTFSDMSWNLTRTRAVFGEFVGCFIFLFLITAGVSASAWATANYLVIAAVFGFGLMAAIFVVAPVSGGHLNAAVTFAIVLSGNMPLLQGCAYVVAQMAGSAAGAGVAYGLVGKSNAAGAVGVSDRHSVGQGLLAEIVGTAILVSVVCSVGVQTSFGKRSTGDLVTGSLTPLAVGFVIFALHLALVAVTGCGVNPTRSFGTAIAIGKWDDHWIYWIGPFVGAFIAVVVQLLLFGELFGRLRAEEKVSTTRSSTRSSPNAEVIAIAKAGSGDV